MINGENQTVTIVAGADLSSHQYTVINAAGTVSANAATAVGILQNNPKSGEHATIAYAGHMKGKAGAAVTLGAAVSVATSGFLTVVASGAGVPVGRALTAAASGDVFNFIGNFANSAITT